MNPDRRSLLTLLAALAAAGRANATEVYPDRPIRIINPFPSGSPVDVIGRLVADRLEKAWGQPVLVESKSGAGGNRRGQLRRQGSGRWLHPAGDDGVHHGD